MKKIKMTAQQRRGPQRLYARTAKEPPPGWTGQGVLVLGCLKDLGQATLDELTQAVVDSGHLKTKQPAKRVVRFYLNRYRTAGYVRSRAAKVESTAKAVAA